MWINDDDELKRWAKDNDLQMKSDKNVQMVFR
jgi:hypothetical protein